MVGDPYTPYFIGVKFDKNRKEEIFLTHLGKLTGATEFIRTILEKAKLE